MNRIGNLTELEVGFDVPAQVGMHVDDVQTPALILDLDALERNIVKMGDHAKANGMRHRAHGKMHKSVDVAMLQHRLGGAQGVCCQKVSEAEAFVRGGVTDVLISNEVRDPLKIDRLARLPQLGASISVCVDDVQNVGDLSGAAERHGTEIECLVEVDCGSDRCGVTTAPEALAIAKAIDTAPALRFGGLQAYHGSLQHYATHAERSEAFEGVLTIVNSVVDTLRQAGLPPASVTGGGTGSYRLESASGVYTELQCGSYAFMDADYGRTRDADGNRIDAGEWENALFILTSIMSRAKAGKAVCDAGLKVQSLDSGLPVVWGRDDVEYVTCSDEHGEISDPGGVLSINEKLRLVPGHCDPTCNLHDWYVGVRGDRVECLWPVSARGKAW